MPQLILLILLHSHHAGDAAASRAATVQVGFDRLADDRVTTGRDCAADQEILNAQDAAQVLGISERLVLRLARDGEIPGRKLGSASITSTRTTTKISSDLAWWRC